VRLRDLAAPGYYDTSEKSLYQYGAAFAQEVQAGLAEGKTFEELDARPPEKAAQTRDIYRNNGCFGAAAWWAGYVSRWD